MDSATPAPPREAGQPIRDEKGVARILPIRAGFPSLPMLGVRRKATQLIGTTRDPRVYPPLASSVHIKIAAAVPSIVGSLVE